MPAATQKRTYSRYALEGLVLLGKMVRLGRMQRRLTAQELAERVGVSRSTLQRMEKGMTALSERTDDRIALLPKHVYKAGNRVIDEF